MGAVYYDPVSILNLVHIFQVKPCSSHGTMPVLQTDASGSLEAVKAALSSLPQDSVVLRYLLATPNDITVSDVDLAAASRGTVLGFNVEPSEAVLAAAKHQGTCSSSCTQPAGSMFCLHTSAIKAIVLCRYLLGFNESPFEGASNTLPCMLFPEHTCACVCKTLQVKTTHDTQKRRAGL